MCNQRLYTRPFTTLTLKSLQAFGTGNVEDLLGASLPQRRVIPTQGFSQLRAVQLKGKGDTQGSMESVSDVDWS